MQSVNRGVLLASAGLLGHSALALDPFNNAPSARPVHEEPSRYGAFLLSDRDPSCLLSLKTADHGVVHLREIDACQAQDNSMASIEAVTRVDSLLFPVISGKLEYHLFQIATSRGGNACDGYDFYVAVLDGARAWVSGTLGDCEMVETASLDSSGALMLGFRGGSAKAQMGEAVYTPTPPPPREVLSSAALRLRGSLEIGSHADNFEITLVDDSGKTWGPILHGDCDLFALGNLVELELRSEVVRIGLGEAAREETELRCVRVLKKGPTSPQQ